MPPQCLEFIGPQLCTARQAVPSARLLECDCGMPALLGALRERGSVNQSLVVKVPSDWLSDLRRCSVGEALHLTSGPASQNISTSF